MNGIDVSGYQPKDITTIVKDYDFVIIKATEGTSFVSPNCDAQYQAAKKRGKLVGVYHFASGGDAAKEAEYFIKNVKGYVGEAILVLDWEAGAVAKGASWVRTFVRRVKELTDVPPIIYGSSSPLNAAGIPGLAKAENCGLWVAAYANNATTGYQNAPQLLGSVIRQYSSHGRLANYAGNLDLNRSTLNAAQWKAYAKGGRGGSTPAPAPKPTPKPVKKTNQQVAKEIVARKGGWGDGDTRIARLKKAGYDPKAVQAIINKLVAPKKPTAPAKVYYTVKQGDIASRIALDKKISLATLDKLNPQVKDWNLIYPGQKLRIK